MSTRLYRLFPSGLLTAFFACAALHCVYAQDSARVMKLPLELLHSSETNDVLVLYITGDGGWNRFSQELGQTFMNRGYSLVALNSRKYFWDEKTPEGFARDVSLVINHFLTSWKKKSVVIVGYSFGADVAAFLPGRLQKSLIVKTRLMVLLSAAASTDFVIRLSDLVGGGDSKDRKYDVGHELCKSSLKTICLFGADEGLILQRELRPGALLKVEELPGSHHYNQASGILVEKILTNL